MVDGDGFGASGALDRREKARRVVTVMIAGAQDLAGEQRRARFMKYRTGCPIGTGVTP